MRRNADGQSAVLLADHEYDADGWPLAKITLELKTYSHPEGPRFCWLAELDGLPGYYGEGATPAQALERLLDGPHGLGPRPHFRASHKFRGEKLEADVRRRARAVEAAARSRAHGAGYNLGGGEGVETAAKEMGVGKPAVNAVRARWKKMGLSSDVPTEVWETIERVAEDQEIEDLWAAEQTPWRLEHAAAREMFPTKNR